MFFPPIAAAAHIFEKEATIIQCGPHVPQKPSAFGWRYPRTAELGARQIFLRTSLS